jgi:hypothetical protein
MNTGKFQSFLEKALINRQKVLVKGSPGIGKSSIFSQVAKKIDFQLMVWISSISDPSDIKGLPTRADENKHAEFLPYDELYKLIHMEKDCVCLFDDLSHAVPAVQSSIIHLILARELNGKKISDKVVFAGACNDINSNCGANSLIEPLKSRFNTIVQLDADLESWTAWALTEGNIDFRLIGYLRQFPDALCPNNKLTKDIVNHANPRNWESVNNWIKAGVFDTEVFQGAVGNAHGLQFSSFCNLVDKLPSFSDIESNPLGTKIPDDIGAVYAVVSMLARKATKNNFGKLLSYVKRLNEKKWEIYYGKDVFHISNAAKAKDKSLEVAIESADYIKWGLANQDVIMGN